MSIGRHGVWRGGGGGLSPDVSGTSLDLLSEDGRMTVPTYDRPIEPILGYLAAHPDGALARDVHDAVARYPPIDRC